MRSNKLVYKILSTIPKCFGHLHRNPCLSTVHYKLRSLLPLISGSIHLRVMRQKSPIRQDILYIKLILKINLNKDKSMTMKSVIEKFDSPGSIRN